jgi:hypothetical protein
MKLNRNTQQNTVGAMGAISLLVPLKASLTLLLTNSTTSSTKLWNLPGMPEVALRAAR